ncbi:MAG TPA: hypothetical protein VNM22_12280 [Candidatus Limnocylindrales bacterium]|nr:hypothetical protein [Candidatus Limnocylindrales bacterium]
MYKKIGWIVFCFIFVWVGMETFAKGQNAPYRLSDKDVKRLLDRLEKDSDKFRKSVDKTLDKSRLDSTNREDDINRFVKDFEDEIDRLKDRFGDHKMVSADVEAVLRRAVLMDRFMQRHLVSTEMQGDWAAVKADLDELARAYNVSWEWERMTR